MQKRSGGPDLEFSGLAYCVAFNSRKAARAVTRLYDSALAPVGVRSTQLAVLIALAKSQPLSIGSLAEILSVDTTTLTRSLRPIRKQGLLAISERSAMRQRFVTLTRKGTRALKDSMPLWRDVQTRFATSARTTGRCFNRNSLASQLRRADLSQDAVYDSTRKMLVITGDERIFEVPAGFSDRLHSFLNKASSSPETP